MDTIAYNIAKIHAVIGSHRNQTLLQLLDKIPDNCLETEEHVIDFIIKAGDGNGHRQKKNWNTYPVIPDFSKLQSIIEQNQIKVVSIYDGEYPVMFRHIIDPPPILYLQGTLNQNFKVAVIGPRNPSEYAKAVTASIVRDLIANNITIVSGMAMGIDSVAHNISAKSSAGTIGILGHGIDRVYPSGNRHLYQLVKENPGNCLISEFPVGYPPGKYTFPRRNRLISGLVNGVLVTEAGAKSGTLITARHALDQGKHVFAMPGMITNPLTAGVHQLIRDGATLVTNASEILEELYPMLKIEAEHKKFLNLHDEEVTIVRILEKNPLTLEALLYASQLETTELVRILSVLEIKGVIKKEKNNHYFVTI